MAAVAQPVLRLMDDPPLITSLVAGRDTVDFYSFLTGFRQPMGVWKADLTVFVLAPLALVLAVPRGRLTTKLLAAAVLLPLLFAVCVTIAVVQLRLSAEAWAMGELGITLHAAEAKLRLERINVALFAVGMLALPSFLFLANYMLFAWNAPARPAPAAGLGGRRGALVGLAAGGSVLAVALIAVFAAAPVPSRDSLAYHRGWAALLELNPGFTTAQINLGLHLEREGDLDAAIALYREAIAAKPGLVAAHYNLGNALDRKGLSEQALASYRNALALEPEHAAAHRNLAVVFSRLNRPCDALRHLRRSASLDTNAAADPIVQRNLAKFEAACDR